MMSSLFLMITLGLGFKIRLKVKFLPVIIGKSFIAKLSTTNKGISKIKPVLTPDAGVVTTRFQTNYVVTEYGCVDLRGNDQGPRAKLMISIGAPVPRRTGEGAHQAIRLQLPTPERLKD